MSFSDHDRKQLLTLIAEVQEGGTDVESREWLNALLKQSAEARRFYRRHMELHARLHIAYTSESLPGVGMPEVTRNRDPHASIPPVVKQRSRCIPALAATLVLMTGLALFGWLRNPAPEPFATLTAVEATSWLGSELPTVEGARMGKGTLRLMQGLATVKFDSGAELILEGPTELTLVDAMQCVLHKGTVVGDMPESAHGFRVTTPSAEVIDLGTRFATSYHEVTGETHTQVLEGSVEVASSESPEPVELRTGERHTAGGSAPDDVVQVAERGFLTHSVEPLEFGAGWTLLESVKDAYTGHVRGHESDVLLYVKKGVNSHRTSYMGFALPAGVREGFEDAELILHFEPTGVGLASLVGDCEFHVHGFAAGHAAWDEGLLRKPAFPGQPTAVPLGTFTLPRGVQRGRFGIRTEALRDFLLSHPGEEVTFRVVRATRENETGGLVHGFASRRHPLLPGPTLALRTSPTL